MTPKEEKILRELEKTLDCFEAFLPNLAPDLKGFECELTGEEQQIAKSELDNLLQKYKNRGYKIEIIMDNDGEGAYHSVIYFRKYAKDALIRDNTFTDNDDDFLD